MAEDPWSEFKPAAPKDAWAEFKPANTRQWSDVPLDALKAFPNSAFELGKGLVHGVGQAVQHPIDTAANVGNIIGGVINKTGRPGDLLREGDAAPTPEELNRRATTEAGANAVGDFYKQRYGSGESIKNTLATDPAGVMMDLASILTLKPSAGAMVNPVTLAGRGVGAAATKVVEPAISRTLGFTTGAGADAVRTAARSGAEGGEASSIFTQNLRGQVPATDMVDMAQRGLTAERADRGAAYTQGMGPIKADTTVLDMQPVVDAYADALNQHTFHGVQLRPSTEKTAKQIGAIISEWKSFPPDTFHTAGGLDALKQKIGDVMKSTEQGTPARDFASQIYRSVGGEVKAQAPEYAKVMEGYSNASDLINQLQGSLSLGEKAMPDTAIRKLTSVMRNNVNTNFGERQRLMEVLAKHEPNLPSAIAGQALSSVEPRGLARFGPYASVGGAFIHPAALGTLLMESPRLVGEGAHLVGKVGGAIGRGTKAAGINETNAQRAALLARLLQAQGAQ